MVEPPAEESVRRVQAALDGFGLGLQAVFLRQSARTAREAARALGCEIDSVVKSLIVRGERTGRAYLIEIGGSRRADLTVLAQAVGESVEMATPDFVLAQTGFPIGSVPPVGHRQLVATFIDEALLSRREVWASAGSERAMFRLTPAQLVRITGGKPIRISGE